MKQFVLIFLLSPLAYALDWQTDWHHLEPQLIDIEKSLESLSANDICPDQPPSLPTYISSLPKTENWRSFYKTPTLLDDKLYKVEDVCKEARAQNLKSGSSKPYAIIANKTHFCDAGHRACLSTFKSLTDSCNRFIQDNFQTFHSRLYAGGSETPGSKLIQNEYGGLGPSLLVIRLSDCKLLPTENAGKALASGMTLEKAKKENYFFTAPAPSGATDSKGEMAFKSSDERVRFSAMKESLINNLPDLGPLKNADVDCFEDGKRSFPGVADDEIVQYGEIKMKGLLISRKLMDEQFLEKYGRGPYKK